MANLKLESDFPSVSLPSSSWCIFCLRNYTKSFSSDGEDLGTDNQSRLKQFLKLFGRYTGRGGNDNLYEELCQKSSLLSEKRSDLGDEYGTCEDCFLVLQDFCDFYEKVKVLEMKLDWKLQTLKSIMRSADKVSFRSKRFREKLEGRENGGKDLVMVMKGFRNKIVMNTSRKLKLAFPRVKLMRCSKLPLDDLSANEICENDSDCHERTSVMESSDKTSSQMRVNHNLTIDYNDGTYLEPESQLCNIGKEFVKSEEIYCDGGIRQKIGEEKRFLEPLSSPPFPDKNSIRIPVKDESAAHRSPNSNEHEFQTVGRIMQTNNDLDLITTPRPIVPMYHDHDEEVGTFVEDICDRKMEPTISMNATGGKLLVDCTSEHSCNDDNDSEDLEREELENQELEKDNNQITLKTEDCIGDKSMDLSGCPFKRNQDQSPSKSTLNAESDIDDDDDDGLHGSFSRRNKKRRVLDKQDAVVVNDANEQNSLATGSIPSLTLKELALKHILKLKYKCREEPCISGFKSFLRKEDFLRHSAHHGNFHCEFCQKELDYAPDLFAHEIENHTPKVEDETLKRRCSRCSFESGNLSILKLHFLKFHLDLMPDKRTCGICYLPANNRRSAVQTAREHYLTYHDLTDVDLKTVKKCGVPNCRAYFRTSVQLSQHLSLHKKDGVQQKCPKVNHLKTPCNNQALERLPKLKCNFRKKTTLSSNVKSRKRQCRVPLSRARKQSKHWTTKLSLSPDAMQKLSCEKSCGKCKDVFYSEQDLELHYKLHGNFQCNSCSVVMDSVIKLFRHELSCKPISQKLKLYSCPRCEYSAPRDQYSNPKLMKHFLRAHFDLSLDHHSCPICDQKFSNRYKKLLQVHLKKAHDFSAKNIYTCEEPDCKAYFNTEWMLLIHRNTHKIIENPNPLSEDDRKFQCRDCLKWFLLRSCLLNHVKRDHMNCKTSGGLPYSCPSDGCKRQFENQHELDSHLETKGRMICPECGKCFHGQQGLNAHLSSIHNPNRQRKKKKISWVCEACGKEFKDGHKLRVHSLSHSGPDSWQYSCETCGKKIMTKHKLDEHMRTHSKEKPFTCDICGVSYAHRHNLRIHVNSKHSDITSDPPKRFDKSRLVSRKGIKLKKMPILEDANETGKSKRRRRGRPRKQPRTPSCSSSDSNIPD